MTFIPYGRQDIQESDIDAVVEVLKSDFLTQGPTVPSFEGKIAQYCDVSHAIAVNSATSALHIACLALGLGPGDTLWTTPITFVASANCALYCGAKVDFVDIDNDSYNLSPEALEVKLISAAKKRCLPKIVVAVHLCGQPCDLKAIHRLSQKYGFSVIEDASHAIGARYEGEPIGSCRYSDIAVFSFHPVKIITSAEGGMAVTNNSELATKMRLLRSHGITREPTLMTHEPDGPWYYQQIELGFNYRMTDLQAALGLSQMTRLDTYVEKRHQLAARYDTKLKALPLVLPAQRQDVISALHLYVVRLRVEEIEVSQQVVFKRMLGSGVGVNLHYIPIHLQPYYKRMGFRKGDFPVSESYYAEAMSIPIYPSMSVDEQDGVIGALTEAIR
ncbi:UDP-4-amino-4,6-dideoxy-N-acetyl-beta-L-altrosamine transaminase [Agrobacterium tumefaciens]|uniref:UDP-4-amino-4, 6-dideoxy-N-acetyl-beta-L-altrosamine transaminase n=1 Tax=Agrobacterium tumefaciens TaxID=358 RepID=UPI00157465DC|nr:UDP-4-amino-4,6-dideoxy-N-acetyl-beta-L-altrosamine transaminase [Agrobacterium tumefaciens]NSZ86814.1 UDP-4-amino-4,6-dideoxy-N-acetyl-beta-L-altrosamine transaminase [Agrobacterium tumefaciens]WCA71997.1 UDP-4-amino-4,6-dideoxy-N-acetyl-beta-L-altrosamine transaminase [Agrobacterium tumefaciens]